jgi:hypothetical protein
MVLYDSYLIILAFKILKVPNFFKLNKLNVYLLLWDLLLIYKTL